MNEPHVKTWLAQLVFRNGHWPKYGYGYEAKGEGRRGMYKGEGTGNTDGEGRSHEV